MAKRYYLTGVIGDGSLDDPYRSKISIYPGVNFVQVLSLDPAEGLPRALVLAATLDHTTPSNDSQVEILPDLSLDARTATLSVEAKNTLNAALQTFEISPIVINTVDGYRMVIDMLGKQLDPAFNLNAFNVSDV